MPTQEFLKAARGNSNITTIEKTVFLKNKGLMNALKKVERKNGKRRIRNRDEGFTDSITGIEIYTETSKYLERIDGSYHSYTFYVTNTPEGHGFENVFIYQPPRRRQLQRIFGTLQPI